MFEGGRMFGTFVERKERCGAKFCSEEKAQPALNGNIGGGAAEFRKGEVLEFRLATDQRFARRKRQRFKLRGDPGWGEFCSRFALQQEICRVIRAQEEFRIERAYCAKTFWSQRVAVGMQALRID